MENVNITSYDPRSALYRDHECDFGKWPDKTKAFVIKLD